jgi:O-antigen/teichoic acid export membrane protein
MIQNLRAGAVRIRAIVKRGGLGHASLVNATGMGVGRAIGLLSALAGALMLGTEQYGAFAYLATTATVISSLSVLGFAPLVTRGVAASRSKSQAATVTGTAIVIVCGLLITWTLAQGAVVTLADLGSTWPEFRIVEGVGSLVVAIWAAATTIFAITSATIAGNQQFRLLTMLTVVRAVAVGGAACAVAAVNAVGAASALAAACADLIVALFSLILLRRAGDIRKPARAEIVGEALKLSKGAIPAGAASLLIQAALWLTQSMLLLRPDGLSENGAFAIATRLCLIVTFLPSALATASVSYIARQDDGALARRLGWRIVGFGTAASLVGMLLAGGVGSYAMVTLSTDYADYTTTTTLMAVAGVAISANVLLGNVAVALGRIRAWVVSDVVLAASLMGIAFLLVPGFGANGAAVASIVSYAVSACVLLFSLRRRSEPPPSMQPTNAAGPVSAGSPTKATTKISMGTEEIGITTR